MLQLLEFYKRGNRLLGGKQKQKSKETAGTIGIVMLIISALVFLCICVPVILGVFSQFIFDVAVGFFGLAAYPIFLATAVLGLMLTRGQSVQIKPKYMIFCGGMILSALLIVHLATSSSLITLSFSQYLYECYTNYNTVGGVFLGLMVYPLTSFLGAVGTYIVLSACFVLFALLFVDFRFLRQPRPQQQVVQQPQFDTFMNYPQGVISSKPYEQKNQELFVSTIIPTPSKKPFKLESGTASSTRPHNLSIFSSDFSKVEPLMEEELVQANHHYSANQARNRQQEQRNFDQDKFAAFEMLYGEEEKIFPKKQPEPEQITPKEQPAQAQFIQPLTQASQVKVNATQTQQPEPQEIPKKPIEEVKLRPQMVVHEPMGIDIIVPKISNVREKMALNPNPIINAEEESKRIIEARKQNEKLNEVQSSLFDDPDFKVSQPTKVVGQPTQSQATQTLEQSSIFEYGDKSDYKPLLKIMPVEQEPSQNPQNSGMSSQTVHSVFTEQGVFSKPQQIIMPKEPVQEVEQEVEQVQEKPTLQFKTADEIAFSPTLAKPINADAGSDGVYADDKGSGFDDRVKNIEKSFLKTGKKEKKPKEYEQIDLTEYSAQEAENANIRIKGFKQVNYVAPPLDMLIASDDKPQFSMEDLQKKARILEETLADFKYPAQVTGVVSGPAVTRYEVQVESGIKLNTINSIVQNIAYSLESDARRIRIEAPMRNKAAVGIELPNEKVSKVSLRSVVESKEFQESSNPLLFCLGKDIAGKNIVCDLDSMPHLLIAGSTGAGKSVCLNSIIVSFMYHASPSDLRLILIDPKRVEFSNFEGIPHLYLRDIVTNIDNANEALDWAIDEMENRYNIFSWKKTKNIRSYNQLPEVVNGSCPKLPYIVIVVDEIGELSALGKREFEERIIRLTAKARAAGIHMIFATQRPSVDVITGTIKVNLPSRIAFAVPALPDSKTILDQGGAEKLMGRGDMLFLKGNETTRIQGCYIDEKEVNEIVAYVNAHNEHEYDEEANARIFTQKVDIPTPTMSGPDDYADKTDPLLKQAVKLIIESNRVTATYIQRRLSVGYARAARLIDFMEEVGFVSQPDNAKNREVLINKEQFEEFFGEEFE